MTPELELRNRYKQGKGWRELFDLLSSYSNRRAQLTVETAADYCGLSAETLIPLFRELASLGLGTFKFGRHGHKTRIEWKYSPRSIGDVARGKRVELYSYDDGGDAPTDGEREDPADETAANPRLPANVLADKAPAAALLPASLASILLTAKLDLAVKLGIEPEQIEITIKH